MKMHRALFLAVTVLILAWLATVMCVPPSYAAESYQCEPTGAITASGTVTSDEVEFCGILVRTDGTNAATVILYDHSTGATGHKLVDLTVNGSDNYGGFAPPFTIPLPKGAYISITGTGAWAIVYFRVP